MTQSTNTDISAKTFTIREANARVRAIADLAADVSKGTPTAIAIYLAQAIPTETQPSRVKSAEPLVPKKDQSEKIIQLLGIIAAIIALIAVWYTIFFA